MKERKYNLKQILNNRGSLSILALPLTVTLLGVCYLLLTQSLKEYRLTKERTHAYQCAKFSAKRTRILTRNLVIINYAIMAAHAAIIKPPVYQALKKLLIAIGNLYSLTHMYLLTKTKHCSHKHNFQFLFQMPFYGKALPKRNFFGLIKMRKKWKNYIFSVPAKELDPLYNSFMIEFTFKRESMELRASTKEINTRVLQRLKHYSGLASSAL